MTSGPPQVTSPITPHSGPTDPQELEAFLDAFFTSQMKELHIPGAVFILVKDGEVFFAKGYGYANLEKRTPVIPDKTIFRVGSVSKLFTATAVMQLYERKQLNLEDDVNKYLKLFQLEDKYPQPVTFANLLTHTAGFDEHFIGQHAKRISQVMPLGQYLATRMPPRTMPPGQVISYNDHAMSLAGYLVEEISEIPFAQHIDENIFQPLGMNRSSFQQPPPIPLLPDIAVGYRCKAGTYLLYPYDYLNTTPIAGAISTATDIARFMMAHLQLGRYGDSRILDESTAREMHRQHFTHHPRLRGRAYGFSEWFENGGRAIFHDGGMPGFNCRLFLLPDQNLGFFVACNSNTVQLARKLTSHFLDHYYPVQERTGSPQPSADFRSRARHFTGYYRYTVCSRHTIEKISTLLSQVRVAHKDRTLSVGSGRYVEVEPLLFQRVDDEDYVAFREDELGRVTHMFIGTGAYEKLPQYETKSFQLILLGFFVIVFLSTCIDALLSGMRLLSLHLPDLSRLLAVFISALNLAFLAGLALLFTRIDPWEFTYGKPPVLTALLVIPVVTAVLTIGLPILTVLAWLEGYWSTIARLHYSLTTVTALAFVPFLRYWKLLGLRSCRIRKAAQPQVAGKQSEIYIRP